jgi:hypothetical protein
MSVATGKSTSKNFYDLDELEKSAEQNFTSTLAMVAS